MSPWNVLYQVHGPNLTIRIFPNLPYPYFFRAQSVGAQLAGAQSAGAQFARAQFAGAQFAKKWQIGPQKVRGPICRQIGEGPNLPGPNLPGTDLKMMKMMKMMKMKMKMKTKKKMTMKMLMVMKVGDDEGFILMKVIQS